MNPVGPSTMPGLIPRGQITVGPTLGIVPGSRVINVGNSAPPSNPPGLRRSTGGTKLMRLRCRFRPLHDQYIKNGAIVEDDTDVIFLCGDGHQLRAHKVIMASSSKFFAKIFEDQTGDMAVVSVPDIKVDIMKLILQLTYRDRVFLTMNQIKEVGEFITLFGMAWTQFGYEEYSGAEAMTATPQPTVPMKPVELPRKVVYVSSPSPKTSLQASTGQPRRVMSASPSRSPMTQQNSLNGNEVDDKNLQGQQSQADRDRRKSRLTPREGTEGEEIVEQEEEDDPENLIRDWMSKLGKRESTSQNGPAAVKRQRTDEGQTESAKQPPNVCSVCGTRFQTEIAWRWHEERHVGTQMFKCKFCDDLTKTPKQCYIHEKEVHGYSGLQQFSGLSAHFPPILPSVSVQGAQGTQGTQGTPAAQTSIKPGSVVYRSSQTGKFVSLGSHNFKKVKMLTNKMKLQAKKKTTNVFLNKAQAQIPEGESEGAELLDVKKIKQLHWHYECQRCQHFTDSAQKAVNHYNQCYPDKELDFQFTVVKYRQGFSGKNKCPLCPRKYPSNTGFMIHCGHQHQEYRRLFTHTGSVDDQLKCVNCKELFPDPTTFHLHMEQLAEGTMYCPEEPKEEPVAENAQPVVAPPPAAKPVTGKPPTGKSERQPRTRRAESPIEHKAQYKVQFHTPPKSARLASRVQAEAQAEAAAAAANKKATDINFPAVDCPVCGDSDLPNISLHLQSKHKDLNVDVTRISSELLRCKGCTITFDICDLLDHKNCLINNESEASAETEAEAPTSSRRASTSAAKVSRSSIVVDMDSLPPGVGRSPIESIEIEDLHSIEAIRTALKCLVCGNEAMRLGTIADCLRSHGIHRCSLCFNSYCNKADYALHLRKCHGAGSNKLKCPLCPKAFANAGQTSGHMYSTHWLAILKENETAMKNKKKLGAATSAAAKATKVEEKVEGKIGKTEETQKEEESDEKNVSTETEDKEDAEEVDSNGIDDDNEEEGNEPVKKKQSETKEDEDVDIE